MSNKGTILVVQANRADSGPLQEHFESGNYKVLLTSQQDEAIMLTRRELPRAIILDLDCPALNPADFVEKVRDTARTRHIHITVLTQRGERTEKLDALAIGADEFMNKPVDVEELGLRVRNALRRAAFDNLANPTTGLPGPRLIEEQLRQLLRRHDTNWVMLRINIRHFGAFNDLYGFLAGEEVLRFAAHLFGQAMDCLGTPDDFLGHSGADNFILITATDQAPHLADEMTERFNQDVKTHYSVRERERGSIVIRQANGNEIQVPLMALTIHTVTAADGPFSDIRELSQA